jgi:hypothetical protein
MALAAFQPQPGPKATPRSTERGKIGQQDPWKTVVPVPRANASSFSVALQITFRNKIPAARVLRCPELMTTFGDGRFSNQQPMHRRLSPETVWLVRRFALQLRSGRETPTTFSLLGRLSELEQDMGREWWLVMMTL